MVIGLRMGAAALAACASLASAQTVLAEFALHDHPGGNAAPPTYGLRIDGMTGGGVTSFSFDTFNDTRLRVIDNGGSLEISIEGTLFGGEHDGMGGYVGGGQAFALDFTYTLNVSATATGYSVLGVDNVGNTGSLTALDAMGNPESAPESVFTITDDNNNAFIFQADGHRLPGDADSWVGRGWLTMNDSGAGTSGTQDWLFTASVIPAPGVLALAGAGLGLAARRRR